MIFNENGGKKSVESLYKETNFRTYESYDDNGNIYDVVYHFEK